MKTIPINEDGLAITNLNDYSFSRFSDEWMDEQLPSPAPLTPEYRADEWVNDSYALLADAFCIRRLLRLVFSKFRQNNEISNCILDAVYIKVKQEELRVELRVMVGWLQVIQSKRVERTLVVLAERNRQKRNSCEKFREWRRLLFAANIARKSERNVYVNILRSWLSHIKHICHSRKRVHREHFWKLQKRSFISWRKRELQAHAEDSHKIDLFVQGLKVKFFKNLISLLDLRREKSRAVQHYNSRIARSVFQEYRVISGLHSVIRREMLSFENNKLGAYLLYKWGLLGMDSATSTRHSGIHYSWSVHELVKSVQLAVIQKWFSFTYKNKRLRAIQDRGTQKIFFKNWRDVFLFRKRMTARLVDFSNTVIAHRPVHLLKMYWGLWFERAQKRVNFRSGLENFVAESTEKFAKQCLQGWRCASGKEMVLSRKCALMAQKVSKSVLHAIAGFARSRYEFFAQTELARLFERKRSFEKLKRVLASNVLIHRDEKALIKKGLFFKKALFFARWVYAKKIRGKVSLWLKLRDHRRCAADRRKCMELWQQAVGANQIARRIRTKLGFEGCKLLLVVFVENRRVGIQKRLLETARFKFACNRTFRQLKSYSERKKYFDNFFLRKRVWIWWDKWTEKWRWALLFKRLGGLHEKCLLLRGLREMTNFSCKKMHAEECCAKFFAKNTLKNVFSEWKLVSKFQLLSQRHRARDARWERSDELLGMYWSTWRHQFGVMEYMGFQNEKNDERIKKLVFARDSGWMLAVKEGRVRDGYECRLKREAWLHWRGELEEVRFRIVDLNRRCVEFQLAQAKIIINKWYMLVADKRLLMSSVLIGWRNVIEKNYAMMDNFKIVLAKRVHATMLVGWLSWRIKFGQRASLRERVYALSLNYTRRLALSVIEGLSMNRDLRVKVQSLGRKINFNLLTKCIDKWIRATVTVASIRELVRPELVEGMRSKRALVHCFERIKMHSRMKAFLQKHSSRALELQRSKDIEMMQSVLLSWKEVARTELVARTKIGIVLKYFAIKRFKRHFENLRTRELLESVADEFAIQQETTRVTNWIEMTMYAWHSHTMEMNKLAANQEILKSTVDNRSLLYAFAQWKYQYEVAVHKFDVERIAAELASRVNFRDKTKVFNQFILMFLEKTEIMKLGIEYHEFFLKRKVMAGFRSTLRLSEKAHQLAQNILRKQLQQSLKVMKTEAKLTRNERLYFSQHNSRHALTQLRIFAKFKKENKQNRSGSTVPYHKQRKSRSNSPAISSSNATPPIQESYRNRRR